MAFSARAISRGERAGVMRAGLPASGEVSLNTTINTQSGAKADKIRRFRGHISRLQSSHPANNRTKGAGWLALSTARVQR